MKYVPMRLPTPREPECSMNHTLIALVETDLDEVVAAAERAEVIDVVAAADARVLVDDLLERRGRASFHAFAAVRRQLAPRAAIAAAAVRRAAVRHGLLDRRAQALSESGSCSRRASVSTAIMPQPISTPTAAGMIAPLRRHDAADGRTDAEVHVGHHRDVMKHDRQPRDVLELTARGILDADAMRPRLDRHT